MRIVFCSDLVPPVIDGVSRTLSELVPNLSAAGVEMLFLAAGKPAQSLLWRDRVHPVPAIPLLFYPSYRVGLPWARKVDPVLDRFAPDLVHVVTPSLLGIYGLRYAHRRGIPVVATFHTNFVSCLRYYGLGWFERFGWWYMRWFYNQCARTLAPSRSVADELRAHGIRGVALWQRGVGQHRFSPAFRTPGLREGIGASSLPVLLYVGRLAREKNLDDLVAAVRCLEQRGDRFKLVIVGDGPMRHTLQDSLPDAHFTGYLHGHALARWYASADIFVLPSTIETFGNVVLEAFASGLPVVGVDRGGVRELITHGVNGLLAPPRAPAAFAELIQSLLVRPEEVALLGLRALETARNYAWPDVNRRLLETYNQVIGTKRFDPHSAAALAFSEVVSTPR